MRPLGREPDSLEAVRAELMTARGINRFYDAHLKRLDDWFKPGALGEATARAFTEDVALALQAAALHHAAPDYVFDGFCAVRLDRENRSLAYGAVTADIDAAAIVERASPV